MTEGNSTKTLHNNSWDEILELLRYASSTYEFDNTLQVQSQEQAKKLETIANTIEAQ